MTTEHEMIASLTHKLLSGGIFLEGKWNVIYKDKTVGKCNVERQGLYYQFICHCSCVSDDICRLILQCSEKNIDLGILVPVRDGFGLEKRIPAKNLSDGEPHFFVKPTNEMDDDNFIPIRAGEAFAYLSCLHSARFIRRNGESGILINH